MNKQERWVFVFVNIDNCCDNDDKFYTKAMTVKEAVKYFRNTLEWGKKLSKYNRVNIRPRTIDALLDNVGNALRNIGGRNKGYYVAWRAGSEHAKTLKSG